MSEAAVHESDKRELVRQLGIRRTVLLAPEASASRVRPQSR